jgi:hypothetical protein
LIAFEFAVKPLDDLGVEFRMKTGRHGINVSNCPTPSYLLSIQLAPAGNEFRLCRDAKIGGDDISFD